MASEHAAYDPAKAHEYYERTKNLKGRDSGAPTAPVKGAGAKPAPAAPSAAERKAIVARISRLKAKVSTLTSALSEAQAALSASRQKATKTAKENSDGKSTAKEKQSSKEYRDKNEAKLKSEAKKESSSSGGSSTSSSSSSKSVSDMSSEELGSRIIKIQSALKDAKSQLSSATQQLGQLAHSAITSDPHVNEHFAQFRSAERIPSK